MGVPRRLSRLPLSRPDLGAYADLVQPEAPPLAAPDPTDAHGRPHEHGRPLRATFLGTSTVLFDDGRTALLTDGFFTRPGLLRVVARTIAPDPTVVDGCLRRAGIDRLDAVICVHSHYDHALDAPLVVERTGAVLVGSESTANLGRGHGLPEAAIRVVSDAETLTFGSFEVTLVESVHSPGDMAYGVIPRPLRPPARARQWRTGTCYSVFVTHAGRTCLVHGSANLVPGALAGRHADVVYLGVAPLGRQSEGFRERYFDEVVLATGARRVVPVHWDEFWRPLDRPLRVMPYAADDLARTMRFLRERCGRAGIDLVWPVAWRRTDPYAGLTPPRD